MTDPADVTDLAVRDRLSDFKLEVERRFARVEKGLVALTLAVVSPKFGGPDLSHTVASVVGSVLT